MALPPCPGAGRSARALSAEPRPQPVEAGSRRTRPTAIFAAAHELAPQDAQDARLLVHSARRRAAISSARRSCWSAPRPSPRREEVSLLRASYQARTRQRTEQALAVLDAAGELGGDAQLQRGRLRERAGRYAAGLAGLRRRQAQAGAGRRRPGVQARRRSRRCSALCRQFFTRETWPALPRAAARGRHRRSRSSSSASRARARRSSSRSCAATRACAPAGSSPSSATCSGSPDELLPGPERYPGNLARSLDRRPPLRRRRCSATTTWRAPSSTGC